MINIGIDGLDEQIRALEGVERSLDNGELFETAFKRYAPKLKAGAAQEAPKRTGYLASQYDTEVKGNDAALTNKAPYAGFVENGTSRMTANPAGERAIHRTNPELVKEVEKEFERRLK